MTATDEKSAAQARLAATCPVRAGNVYRHYKGGEYVVFAVSLDEATLEPLVHYYSLELQARWTRTLANFTEDVGEEVTGHIWSPLRFRLARRATDEELLAALGIDIRNRVDVVFQ